MSCDLLLCPCYVIALRMLCFCFALIIYCKLQARYRPYTFEDKMRTFFSSVYGRVPKGNSLCNPDAVLRTFKITTASPCSLVNASRHRIKIRSRSPFQPGGVQLLHAKACFDDLRAFVSEIGSQSVGCITIHARKTHQRDFQRFLGGWRRISWVRA